MALTLNPAVAPDLSAFLKRTDGGAARLDLLVKGARCAACMSKIDRSVAEIAASAEEQSRALAEVNSAVNQMDHVTQQNAAMVEEATAAAHSLRRETDQLNGLVGRFVLEEAPTSTGYRSAA